ncbi:MAG: nitroreductase family protein [Chloroflexi bacterium]|nr:nitroreductase family protein [Chloroflexota bacterium]MCI0818368.1 nitroreductase family protein [Chloroflexota bacterium]MCI0831644.1 nitroreductase family protein [Chloroflexota bacterium]MCI0838812.1 nitroreductase family protein [Chloroflexota bacterium]MCI0842354.1 nitroreductase family protein [Chloroflexota bacterium]
MTMEGGYQPVADVISQRRSVRQFGPEPVARSLVRELVALACRAPAPHKSRPWRFAYVATDGAKERLAEAMASAWLADLEAVGTAVHDVQRLLARSKEQIVGAPALLVACLELAEAKEQADEGRRSAERDMFVQSLGAALQNILLAAVERGLVGYLKGAPLFCAPAVREALELPDGWEPTFLVLLGHPEEGFEPPPRAEVEVGDIMVER